MLVGLGFSEQLIGAVPAGANDVPVDVVVTPEGTHLCSSRAAKEWTMLE